MMGPVDLRVLACDPPATRVSSKNFQLSPLFSIICLQLLCFQYFALGMYRISMKTNIREGEGGTPDVSIPILEECPLSPTGRHGYV